jgi:two-component system chemotaxis sensor kinase CheA
VAIEIEDDGRGIDWREVARKALDRGLPCVTPLQLQEALFFDGLSTRSEVDSVSGRGVGMGAMRAECEKVGGRLVVRSTPGAGTVLHFSFAANAVCETEEMRRGSLAGVRSGPAPSMSAV